MKNFAVIFISGLFAFQVAGAADINLFEGFVVLRSAGVDNTFYDTDTQTINPNFTNTVAYVGQGEYLLMGGEVKSTRSMIDNQQVLGNNVPPIRLYLSGWNNGGNGGFGFTNWVFFSTNGIGGAAGHFLATGQRAWGSFANDSGNPGAGVQSATASRGLLDSNLLKG